MCSNYEQCKKKQCIKNITQKVLNINNAMDEGATPHKFDS